MATAHKPLLVTVEQYRELTPDPCVIQELHWGQVVTLTRPKPRHVKLQSKLVRLLRPKTEHLGYVESELPFRALPQYDLRAADVAFVSQARWDAAEDEDLQGSPELVIEVLSRSNTAARLQELAALCLSTGAREFWIVDPRAKAVSVTGADGETRTYAVGEVIPLVMFSAELAVSAIFE